VGIKVQKLADVAVERSAADLSGLRGANQTGLRDHNERLVLSMIQRQGSLASADLARQTQLSPQTVSVILRKLEADGLLTKSEPVRGKVGKPLTPVALNPDGVRALGLLVGRRASELAAVDFNGRLLHRREVTYPYPTPAKVMDFVRQALPGMMQDLSREEVARLAGIGVSSPFQLWNWLSSVNAPAQEMDAWRGFDLAAAVAEVSGLEVTYQNDVTSACTAEHLYGRGREFDSYAYFYIGSFIGGGIVLNGTVYPGRSGNAGAVGTLPVPDAQGQVSQLIRNASIYTLERDIVAAHLNPAGLWAFPRDPGGHLILERGPVARTGQYLAIAAVAVCSVIDFDAVLIDGAFPGPIRERVVATARAALRNLDTQGIVQPVLEEAKVGRNARVIGAAALPILSRYLLSQSAFR
jgi:predicted NBD/HSP70 family sugar kinase